jgi:pyrroline-5-carboxylate reductase
MVEFQSLGILGVGNMGGALARGLLRAGVVQPQQLSVYDAHAGAMDALVAETGARPTEGVAELFAQSDVIILAVKPQIFHHIAPALQQTAKGGERTILSVMAGVPTAALRNYFPPAWKVVRVMPNLPLSVGEGATAIETDGHSEGTLLLAERIFNAGGSTVRVSSAQMDAVTGLSGSGPMYVFEFIEGLVAAGVKAGLPRGTALTLVLQTVRGSLRLLEDSGEHPSVWTARVCSPGGTTIHGLHVLEEAGFRGTLIAAVQAAVQRSQELSKK